MSYRKFKVVIQCTVYSNSILHSCFLEYKKRFEIYKENLVLARKMQDMEQGSAKYGETVYSDLTGLCLVGVKSSHTVV